jgi:hypothetical protein
MDSVREVFDRDKWFDVFKNLNLEKKIVFYDFLRNNEVPESFIEYCMDKSIYIDDEVFENVIKYQKFSSTFWKKMNEKYEKYKDCFAWSNVFAYQDLDEDFLEYFIVNHEVWWEEGWNDSSIELVFCNMSRFQSFSLDFSMRNSNFIRIKNLKLNEKMNKNILDEIIDSLNVYLKLA